MYKYKIAFNGDTYIGNSVDEVASNISKDVSNNISFTEAVLYVNKHAVPVVHTKKPEIKIGKQPKAVGINEMASGAKAILLQTVFNDVVDQQEINRRANICEYCPKIATVSGCKACGMGKALSNFSNKIKQSFGGGYKIPSALDQNYCSVCSCSLAMLLPATLQQISKSEKTNPKRPKSCWMKQ